MDYNKAEYWNEEIKTQFQDRDELSDSNYFVISYMQSPQPCGLVLHNIMNFSSFEKMLGYIKFNILRPALGDAFGIDYEKAIMGNLEKAIKKYLKESIPTDEQREAFLLWNEIDHILESPKEVKRIWLKDFRDHFEYLFHHATDCIYGLEVVFPDESLIDFWEEFFTLDREDPDDLEELNELEESLLNGDVDSFDEILMNHC